MISGRFRATRSALAVGTWQGEPTAWSDRAISRNGCWSSVKMATGGEGGLPFGRGAMLRPVVAGAVAATPGGPFVQLGDAVSDSSPNLVERRTIPRQTPACG